VFVLSNLLMGIAQVLGWLFTAFWWLIIIRALISWVNPDPYNPIVQFLFRATEPVLQPVRRVMPAMLRSGIDISPIIVLLLIVFLRSFLIQTLVDIAWRLR
jgi:YggT family protein